MPLGGPPVVEGRANRRWRAAVLAEADAIRAEIVLVARERGLALDDDTKPTTVTGGSAADRRLAQMVLERVRVAESYVTQGLNPFRWIAGSQNDGAWTELHAADALLVELVSPARLASAMPRIVRTCRIMPASDPQRVAVQRIARARSPKYGERERGVLRDALKRSYEINELRYQRARGLRNLSLTMAFLLLVFAIVAICVGHRTESALPMCVAKESGGEVCPTGGSKPSGGDVLLVVLVGMAGAAVSAARSLVGATQRVGPYSTVAARGALKIALGAVLAVAGVTLLRAGWVPGVDDFEGSSEIVAWALLFGYTQQVLTGLLDQRAEKVLAPDVQPADPEGDVPPGDPDDDPPPTDTTGGEAEVAPADADAAPAAGGDAGGAGDEAETPADAPAEDGGEVVDEDDVAADEGDAPPDVPPVDEVDPTARLVPDVPAPPRKPARSAAKAVPAKRATPRRGAAQDG